ncbi:MAG: DUF4136 domain-containing protein [Pseudomonadota bacterium]
MRIPAVVAAILALGTACAPRLEGQYDLNVFASFNDYQQFVFLEEDVFARLRLYDANPIDPGLLEALQNKARRVLIGKGFEEVQDRAAADVYVLFRTNPELEDRTWQTNNTGLQTTAASGVTTSEKLNAPEMGSIEAGDDKREIYAQFWADEARGWYFSSDPKTRVRNADQVSIDIISTASGEPVWHAVTDPQSMSRIGLINHVGDLLNGFPPSRRFVQSVGFYRPNDPTPLGQPRHRIENGVFSLDRGRIR